MKKVYTAFSFGSYVSPDSDVLNVTLENDMYNENIKGSRQIIEDKVQGVEAPYFFYVDDEPLEFEVNFAFEAKTKTDIKTLMRQLIAPKNYRQLNFGEYELTGNPATLQYVVKSPNYRVIFTGEPVLSFIGRNVGNEVKYDGYFTLQARCDRPYGYQNTTGSLTRNSAGETHTNIGDLEVAPNITIANTSGGPLNFTIKRYLNNTYNEGQIESQLTFTNIANNETITISGELFTIQSNPSSSTTYTRWDKNQFNLSSGINYIKVLPTSATTANFTVTLSYDAPLFIKE